ncbi:DUF3558 domain-containing protein [Rhodococcus sp. D2-41]|uniref:DUF3558 domain-containing protein n=1 Tax=Speluncibacter jeojiensis TaxID=2710754 RepID=UPI00240F3780|nr:DUF3558 domain-containing protein [Rhodococcus sp. D2-41]MDG3011294.1 DUF3558 domain-containing protein [Rhodococcus sp. D2-41]
MVVLMLAGCDSSSPSVAGNADSTTVTASPIETADPSAGLWDPCAGMPADVLAANGVNPVRGKYSQGVPIRGWKRCGWLGDWFNLSVLTTHHTIDELKASGSYSDIHSVTIGDRVGTMDHQSVTDYSKECTISLPTQNGMVEVMVNLSQVDGGPERDLCAKATELATAFLPYLPK